MREGWKEEHTLRSHPIDPVPMTATKRATGAATAARLTSREIWATAVVGRLNTDQHRS
jgi:hypothetical protein